MNANLTVTERGEEHELREKIRPECIFEYTVVDRM
jgi:hypothetical protein